MNAPPGASAAASRGMRIAWRRELVETLKGYGVLVVAAFLTALLMTLARKPPTGPDGTYVSGTVLIEFWSTFSASGLWVTAVASVVGALLIATQVGFVTTLSLVVLAWKRVSVRKRDAYA